MFNIYIFLYDLWFNYIYDICINVSPIIINKIPITYLGKSNFSNFKKYKLAKNVTNTLKLRIKLTFVGLLVFFIAK